MEMVWYSGEEFCTSVYMGKDDPVANHCVTEAGHLILHISVFACKYTNSYFLSDIHYPSANWSSL